MMESEKKMNDNNNMTITITEKINLQKVLYLYSLNEEELFKFCKKDKDIKYYNSTINTLADYIINGNDTNDKVYVKNNCNRYYCNNSLQLLQTDIRNFIYPDNTYDYDIKNCSASIMLYLSKVNNLDYKHIDYYVNNRDSIIEKYKKVGRPIDILFSWMVGGCIKFYKLNGAGIKKPRIVLKYIQDKLDDNDVVGRWVNDFCDIKNAGEFDELSRKDKKKFTTSVSDLYDEFSEWAKENGCHKGITKLKFSKYLDGNFKKKKQKRGGNAFERITLKSEKSEGKNDCDFS